MMGRVIMFRIIFKHEMLKGMTPAEVEALVTDKVDELFTSQGIPLDDPHHQDLVNRVLEEVTSWLEGDSPSAGIVAEGMIVVPEFAPEQSLLFDQFTSKGRLPFGDDFSDGPFNPFPGSKPRRRSDDSMGGFGDFTSGSDAREQTMRDALTRLKQMFAIAERPGYHRACRGGYGQRRVRDVFQPHDLPLPEALQAAQGAQGHCNR